MRLHSGTQGDIPARCPAHPDGCPGIELWRGGPRARRWPTLYLTPAIVAAVRIWRTCTRLHAAPVDGPLLAWPSRLVDAWTLLDSETADGRSET